ncbi:MAG: phage tail protein [Prolixibacteraceae bacterium]|jgi:phage tail-like protein|nr:phage tail protein [Prolixibacteraceae bacterium]MBT6767038.1 phage tail protein [Prolixibacteraceae bacterium]MBT6996977.1 phage tail protein [Prolixibacteraceae bacterium]MBT7394243.1 phage tail protein [Prolixibacteraceae bacterium]
MASDYAPVGFHFKVEFTGIGSDADVFFQSVTGLSVDIDTEEIAEGGENRFKHKLPVRTKYPNLVLKRGLLVNSDVIKWCNDAIQNGIFNPVDIIVKLLNEKHEPLMTWNVVHAYPVKWAVSDFNAEESKIVIETIELVYNYFSYK